MISNSPEPAPKKLLVRHGLRSQKQFKGMKRDQLKRLLIAFKDYKADAQYCPVDPDTVARLEQMLTEMAINHSVRVWGE